MKTHIIFDIDGTLLNTTEALVRSLQGALAAAGKHMPRESLGIFMGITGPDTLKQLGIADVEGTLRHWEELLREEAWRITTYEGVEELVRTLYKRGYRLGMVTSKSREEFLEDRERIPCVELFGTVVCADDTREHKPDPAPLRKYLELTGICPEEAYYIGDSAHDLSCAAGAGVDFALAGWGAVNKDLPASHILEKPAEFLDLL